MEKEPSRGKGTLERRGERAGLWKFLENLGARIRAALTSSQLPVALDYDLELKVHLCDSSRFNQIIATFEASGFKVKMHFGAFVELEKDSQLVRIVEKNSRFYRNIKMALDHHLTDSMVDGDNDTYFEDALRELEASLGRNARVLYVGAGDDTSVESVFPNTLHLDVVPRENSTSSSRETTTENINQTTLPDESFNLVVFRFFPDDEFNEETANKVKGLLKKGGKVLISTSRILTSHREARLEAMGSMWRKQQLLTQVGLTACNPNRLESDKVFEKNNDEPSV